MFQPRFTFPQCDHPALNALLCPRLVFQSPTHGEHAVCSPKIDRYRFNFQLPTANFTFRSSRSDKTSVLTITNSQKPVPSMVSDGRHAPPLLRLALPSVCLRSVCGSGSVCGLFAVCLFAVCLRVRLRVRLRVPVRLRVRWVPVRLRVRLRVRSVCGSVCLGAKSPRVVGGSTQALYPKRATELYTPSRRASRIDHDRLLGSACSLQARASNGETQRSY